MDPGQDLLLAALSESGICPNDFGLFDVDSQDAGQTSTAPQVRPSSVHFVGVDDIYSLQTGWLFPLLAVLLQCIFMELGGGVELEMKTKLFNFIFNTKELSFTFFIIIIIL